VIPVVPEMVRGASGPARARVRQYRAGMPLAGWGPLGVGWKSTGTSAVWGRIYRRSSAGIITVPVRATGSLKRCAFDVAATIRIATSLFASRKHDAFRATAAWSSRSRTRRRIIGVREAGIDPGQSVPWIGRAVVVPRTATGPRRQAG